MVRNRQNAKTCKREKVRAWTRKNERMWKRKNGGATVFFCILLSVMIPLVGILVDLARFRLARGHVREAMRLTADSLLAGYDRPLREQYGLFSIACGDPALFAAKAESLLSANLTPMKLDGVRDLYGFRLESLQVVPLQNLSERDVLRRQVAEFMKYRAPLQMAAGFIEKFKAFSAAAEDTAVIRTDMELDREAAAIRRDTMYLSLLLERMRTVGSESQPDIPDLRDSLERKLSANLDAACQSADTYGNQKSRLDELIPERDRLSGRLALLTAETDAAKTRFSEAERVVSVAEAALDKHQKQVVGTETDKIEEDRLIQALADAKGAENAQRLVRDNLCAEWERLSAETARFEEEKWCPNRDNALSSLERICLLASGNLDMLMQLEEHLNRHKAYLEKGTGLVDSLIAQLAVFSGTEARGDAEVGTKNAGSTRGTLKATLVALPAPLEPERLRSMREELLQASNRLAAWLQAATGLRKEAESLLRMSEEMHIAFQRADAGAFGPGTGAFPESPAARLSEWKNRNGPAALGQFSTYGGMRLAGCYALPDCPMIPAATEAEQIDFADWFSGWSGETLQTEESGEDGSSAGQIRKARASLRDLRQAAGKTARGMQEGAEGKSSPLPAFSRTEAETLPSGAYGHKDSRDALMLIGELAGDLDEIRDSLNPLIAGDNGSVIIHEHTANLFTRSIDRVVESAEHLKTVINGAPGVFLEELYMNTYVLSMFKNGSMDGKTSVQSGWSRNLEDTAFEKGEAEYVLFGMADEAGNLTAMKGSLFASRLAMNLVHVYTTPAKESATLALATLLAGWTVLGVPVVQNFLMISWAAAESCVDVDKLCKGESVPLVKTVSTWVLDPGGIRGDLIQKLLLDPAGQMAARGVGNGIARADEAVRETMGGWIDAGVDEAFAPLEAKCADAGQYASESLLQTEVEMPEAIAGAVAGWVSSLPATETAEPLMDRFENLLALWLETFRNTCAETVKLESARHVAALRERVKAEIKNQVFQSSCYRGLVNQAEEAAKSLLNGGMDVIGRQADNIFGAENGMNGLKAGVTGRMMNMEYADYLSLYLMMVPGQIKSARIGDLMQLNLSCISAGDAMPMMNRNTAVYLRADVSMQFWFLPDRLLRKTGYGRISEEWGQSY